MKRNSFVITLALLTLLATASAVQAAPPSSPFTGTWLGQDTLPPAGDGSMQHLVVKGGSSARIDYQDEFGQVCWDAGSTDFWFSSTLRGTVSGNTMTGVFKSARCGHLSLTFMKGQSMVWTFDPHGAGAADDTLFDGVVTWRRV
ncbi:MAG: hypothetical protein WD402_04065 [Chloroflexota bacterium]